jgi:enoyl-CoA hydratase/carnithine racemase
MQTFSTIQCALRGAVAVVTLNRPETRNAMSHVMVDDLLACFNELAGESHRGVRIVIIRAAGKTFCAGGDVRDLAETQSPEEGRAAVGRLDELLSAVNEAPQVVVARVQGAALGGGLGLVCVSDIAVAGSSAVFALPEVRLGLVPSIISPYVVARVGMPRARQLMLTGQQISAPVAAQYGLIHDICADEDLDSLVERITGDILAGAPQALRECKRLLFAVAGSGSAPTLEYRIDLLERLRAGSEAQEGMLAFMEKRQPPWREQASK